jgi:predicted 3-demethylubiquinone-9 3-methyltransferase (glyoxalase superfamily)
MIQKIKPFRWFDGQAEEVANFYVSIFKDSKNHQHLAVSRSSTRQTGCGDDR